MILQAVLVINLSFAAHSSGQLTQWLGQLEHTAGHLAGQLVGQATTHFARAANDFARFINKSEQAQRNFTASEVAQCTGESGRCLYIICDGKVLDLTDFVHYHAGGSAVLLQHGGQDASAAMRAASMPPEVFDVFLNKFVIGTLVPTVSAIPTNITTTTAPPTAHSCGWFATSIGLCEYIVRIEKMYTDYSGLIRRIFVLTSATYDEFMSRYDNKNTTRELV